MRRFSFPLIMLVCILNTASEAQSDKVIVLDVTKICRGIASQSTDPMAEDYPTVSYDRCMQAEQEDRDQLVKEWPTFSSDDKKHCVALAKMGDEPSYTELITCLEMARDVRELHSSIQSHRGRR